MQITLSRTGGYAGIPLTVTVNTATLAQEKANYLHQLIDAADFFQLSGTMDAFVQPDRYEYEITVESGDRVHTVMFTETAIPDALRSLIMWLLAREHTND
jgi:hypothetical protein